ncbi:protein E5A [Equid gammaherpesvirus 2]|nr:protein E5A [Equid gammaherpesvirus 2]UTM04553.1 protein E5A [Equid gammaherpesvirus 2]UTM05025.1 protein E5A [Equid gammaherpesvirus 2]
MISTAYAMLLLTKVCWVPTTEPILREPGGRYTTMTKVWHHTRGIYRPCSAPDVTQVALDLQVIERLRYRLSKSVNKQEKMYLQGTVDGIVKPDTTKKWHLQDPWKTRFEKQLKGEL